MSRRATIDNHVLRAFVGLKSESGVITEEQVRQIVGRIACDVKAPPEVEIAGFLEVEDIPEGRRSRFIEEILDAVSSMSKYPEM